MDAATWLENMLSKIRQTQRQNPAWFHSFEIPRICSSSGNLALEIDGYTTL